MIRPVIVLCFCIATFCPPTLARANDVSDALTFYASFDNGIEADFSKGDGKLFTRTVAGKDEKTAPGIVTEFTSHQSSAGRNGSGALRFTKRDAPWLFYKADKNLAYAKSDWAGSVSLWLKLDPQQDLAPGYCDPIQITTRKWNDGAFFVDFDKEGQPRDFRLGSFPDLATWNPDNKDVPESNRPLCKVQNPPFSREKWTHIAFTWSGFNNNDKNGAAQFYLNGKHHGSIENWNQKFTWKDDENARIWIGLNYIGLFDDLSCYNRELSADEIVALYQSSAADVVPQATTGVSKPVELKRAFINGDGPGWRALGEKDFVNVNCKPDTWRWEDGTAYCTGRPTGVIRSTKEFTNFEMVAEWMHKKSGGNSGIFVWGSPASMQLLLDGKRPLPYGIEVQVLDLGYAEKYKKRTGKPADWFTSHGDVFPTGPAKMTPFPPVAPNGTRSFPTKNLTLGINQWNHYYIRAINGEVRLWVNGEEVSGGTNCDPKTGYLCLESEGSPVVFRNLKIRELP